MTGSPADDASAIRLVAASGIELSAPRLGETIVSAAEAAAERMGVRLRSARIESDALELEVDAPMIVAMGLAAEVRRATDRWHLEKSGRHLWVSPGAEFES